MKEYLALGALLCGGGSLLILAISFIAKFAHDNKKKATLECKIIPTSRRLIWRIVNTGVRDLTIVEIGIRCASITASYRPLYAATEDINNIPHLLIRGDIASYRKDMDQFAFRQSEADRLKISNPFLHFYVKDAEGKVYEQRSDYKFVQYLTLLMGDNK